MIRRGPPRKRGSVGRGGELGARSTGPRGSVRAQAKAITLHLPLALLVDHPA